MPPRINEEDVDDLDDVLEEFNKPAPPSRPPIPPVISQQPSIASSLDTSNVSSTVPNANDPGDDSISEEFAKQFAAEMEAMMRTLSGEDAQSSSSPETEAAKKFHEAWEKMVIEDLEADGRGNDLLPVKPVPSGDDSKQKEKLPSDASGNGKEDPFQRAIRQAIDKLHDSDETLKADSKNPASQDALENLLSTLGELNVEDGEGEGLESMLETMMSQLMSKEILYDPLKELHTKYPEYLNEQKSSLSPEELHRYTQQSQRVSQIVAIFEKESYSDEDSTQSTEILRLMNEMQSFGSPPPEIMGEMPPGFEFGEDGLPKLPEGCTIC